MFLYYFTDRSTQRTNYQQQMYPWPVPSFQMPQQQYQQPNVTSMCKLKSSLNVFYL